MSMNWCAHLGPVGSPRCMWARVSQQAKMWRSNALKCKGADRLFNIAQCWFSERRFSVAAFLRGECVLGWQGHHCQR